VPNTAPSDGRRAEGTWRVALTLTMTRGMGTENDGYADQLSLTFI
jgi:hypothetical protein